MGSLRDTFVAWLERLRSSAEPGAMHGRLVLGNTIQEQEGTDSGTRAGSARIEWQRLESE
jgi:hypothetical protein